MGADCNIFLNSSFHFVTVGFGRNSFTSQRSLSTHIKLVHTIKKPLYGIWTTNFEYSFKNITFCHCCVWKKQLYLSKISINAHKTGSYYKEATLWDLNNKFWIFIQEYYILSLLGLEETALSLREKKQLYISKNSINTHKTGSLDKEATLWFLNPQILNIH